VFAQECTSCCDFPFCNEHARAYKATNDTEALLQSAMTSSAPCRRPPSLLRDVIAIVVIATVARGLRDVT